MTDYGGFQGRVLAGAELTASYGTKSVTWDTVGLLQGTVKVDETNNMVEVGGVGHRNTQAILSGKYGVTGSFDYMMQDANFCVFSLGQYDATSPVANTPFNGVYKHYTKSGDTVKFPSFSLHAGVELGGTDKVTEVVGCKVASQSFRGDLESPVQSTVNYVGQKTDISDTSAEPVTELLEDPWMMHSVGTVMTTDSDSMKAKVTAFDWTVTNQLKPVYAADSRLLKDLLCTKQSIAGNLTMNFEDNTELEKFLSSAASPTAPVATGNVKEFDTLLTFANEAVGSESVAYRGLSFKLLKCKFNTYSFNLPKEDALTQTFGFVAETAEVYSNDIIATDTYAFS